MKKYGFDAVVINDDTNKRFTNQFVYSKEQSGYRLIQLDLVLHEPYTKPFLIGFCRWNKVKNWFEIKLNVGREWLWLCINMRFTYIKRNNKTIDKTYR